MSGMADVEQAPAAGIMKDEVAKGDTQPGMAVVSGDEYVQHDAPKRRAHICCGCCCDTRKAVFVVNIISMSFYGYGLMIVSALWAGIRAINNGQITYDDDAMNNAISEMSEMDGTSYGLVVALFTIGIVCNGIAIYGASNFNKISVLIGGMWCVVEAVRSLAYLNLGGAFMAACFAYPHFVFYWEMKQGIMTRESYPQEKHCCEC